MISKTYNDKTKFFLEISDLLNRNSIAPYDKLCSAFEKTKEFFKVDGAFLYEADYTGKLILNKKCSDLKGIKMKEDININELFTEADIRQVYDSPFIYYVKKENIDKSIYNMKLLEFLNQPSCFWMNVVCDEGGVVGICGMLNCNSHSEVEENDAITIGAILAIAANTFKLSLYKQRYEYSKLALERTMNHSGVDIYVTDFYTDEILYANETMAAPYGGISQMVGKTCWKILYNDKEGQCDYCPRKHLIDENGNPTNTYSWDYQRPFDKSWFRVFSSACIWVDGRTAHVICSANITDNKTNELLISQMAFYDGLTKIPNRNKFQKDFQSSLADALSRGVYKYILFCDLDNFKYVNDQYGHEKGDTFLRQVAEYLNNIPKYENHAYRYGGDEFILLFDDITEAEIAEIVDKIHTRFKKSWHSFEKSYLSSVSIGVTRFPSQELSSSDEILHAADLAMYKEKIEKKTS